MKRSKISEYVSVAPRYLRAVNLSNNWNRAESLDGYIVTPNVAQSLDRISSGLLDKNGQRTFTLIGPYGTGKSAFTVYLCQLLAYDDQKASKASERLSKGYLRLVTQFEKTRRYTKERKGFLPIAVTARRRPVAQLILEGLWKAVFDLEMTTSVQQLLDRIQLGIDRDYWKDTATILKFIGEIGDEAKAQGYAGQLLIIDEAGKTLEYALQDKEGGDVYVFQEIAEYASDQNDSPFIFLITLHQMFDDYVGLAERTIRAEWTKVQERFQTIQFTESAATTMQMLADAIQLNSPLPAKINEEINNALRQFENSSVPLPAGLINSTFQDIARSAWPLHPTVLLAMPHLFRRLAQNERSMFSYLTSHEPFGFQEHVQKTLDTDTGFVRLHDLYAYLLANFEAGLARLRQGKRLLEANDIINSRRNLLPREYDLIRTVAVLNVLGEMCPLRATLNFLEIAASSGDSVAADLSRLKHQSVLTYRNLDESYRVWEGSDVDIEAQMKEALRHLHMEGGSFLETLRRNLPERRLVARRHSLETGSYRFFQVLYADRIEKPEAYLRMETNGGASGWVVVLLPHADAAALRSSAEKVTGVQPRLIIALPRQIEALRSVVEEVACLRWVEDNTEELRDDRVARRELSLRLVEAEQKIAQLLQTLLDPRLAPVGNTCQWFWNGKDQAPEHPIDVTKLLSQACDYIYPKSPRLRNELIARKIVSSAASAARHCLLERMFTCAELERLGIEGFPPERSIYESVLHAGGLHTFDHTNGVAVFQAPPSENPINFRPCWDFMEQEIFETDLKKVEVQGVFTRLAEAPYGLPEGVHSILFTAFYLVNQDDLFLYREGSFVSDPEPAHFELLQRRPDLFSISGARLDGVRRAVVQRLAKGLKIPSRTASVVRALFGIINRLPPVTLKSSKIAQNAVIEMRNRFLQARSPEDLLFFELPECFGMKPFLHNEMREGDIECFFEKLNSCLAILSKHASELQDYAENILLNNCNLAYGKNGWKELERRAIWMEPRISHEILTPFLKSILRGIDDNHNSKPALSLVANRSFEHWTDLDVERFSGLASGIGAQFRQAWRNFGERGTELSEAELQQKVRLRQELEPQFRKIRGQASVKVLSAALRELLLELECESE